MDILNKVQNIFPGIWFAGLAMANITCSSTEVATRSYPVVNTNAVTEINSDGATLNGEILNLGSPGVSDCGFVLSSSPAPTIGNSNQFSLGPTSRTGKFSTLANRDLTEGVTYFVKTYAITKTNDIIVYGQEMQFVSLGSTAPVIADFVPKQGQIGDTVVLVGSGFSNVSANNKIIFGSSSSQPIKSKPDSIWCIVPTSTAAGVNIIALTVGQYTVTAASKFTLNALVITSFTPTQVTFGDTLTITGAGIPRQKNLVAVALLGKVATIIKGTTSQLKVTVPSDVTLSSSHISLTGGVQVVSSSGTLSLLPPVISGFTPAQGTKSTEVTINGNYFDPVSTNNAVQLNGANLSVEQVTKTTLKVLIPSGIAPGDYPFKVTIAGQSASSSTNFRIIQPGITAVAPLHGTWGTTVTITGTNFDSNPTNNDVKFGSVAATVLSASSTQLQVQVPNDLLSISSLISVQVVTVDNLKAGFGLPFVLDPPTISNFSPQSGKSSSLVTISGQNFSPIPSNQVVTLQGKPAVVTGATNNQLTIQLPTSLIDSLVQIEVTVDGQPVTSTQFFQIISPWRRVASFPGTPRANSVAFSIGNFGFVGLGTKASLTARNDFWKYDAQNNAWQQIPDFSYFGTGGSDSYVGLASFSLGGIGYTGLGSIGGWPEQPMDEMSTYDPAGNQWARGSTMPNGGVEAAVSVSINGYGFVATGRGTTDATFTMWQFDPTSNAWTRKADMPASSRWQATGFAIGTKAYVVGGAPCSRCVNYLTDSWSYETTTDTWTSVSGFPGTPRDQSVGFAINGIGYTLGGQYNEDESRLGDFWKFDPSANLWTRLEDFPGGVRAGAVVFVVNNKAYVGTGLGAAGYLKDFWEFDPSKL